MTRRKKTPKLEIALPSWLPVDTWQEFLEERAQTMKKPVSEIGAKRLINKLDCLRLAGHDPEKVIDQSIENTWAGFWPLKVDGKNGSAPPETYDAKMQRLSEELNLPPRIGEQKNDWYARIHAAQRGH